jgi:hypothetical protein
MPDIPSLSGSYIDQTFQRLVQVSGSSFADGLGNPITLGPPGTVNPTPNYLPFNDAGTFQDSYLNQSSSILKTTSASIDKGLSLDFASKEYTLGDYNNTYNGFKFIVNDTNQFIKTVNGSGDNGIIITNSFTFFGIRNNIQYLYFSVDYGLNSLALRTTNDISDGIELDLNNRIYKFGSYNLGTTWIEVDDQNNRITITGSVLLNTITDIPQSNVVTIDTVTGQLYYTASSAFGGGGGPVDTSGLVTTSSFYAFTSSINNFTASSVTSASLALVTASVNSNVVTFTKGNGTQFSLTVNTGSATATPGDGNGSIQFNGNGVFSGSSNLTFNSGSNILTLTGSLNITGSTTQVGNNTLLGTTLLSGSITISGSQGPGSPTASVQIYGDIRQSGYHRFDPVTTNIDQYASASYIYVSGSTQDLYFSQNGGGYSNITRLRWLEAGALYTGLLRGGVITSTPGTTTFNISSGSGLLVTMNASTASEPYPTVQYISWPDFTTQPIQYSGSAKITYIGISNAGTVIQQTVPWGSTDINQWDNSLNLGVVLHLSGSVSTGVFNSPQISYGGQQKTDDFFRAFGPLKISGHTLRASGSSPTLSIIKDAGTSYREGANYTINANHPSTVVENSINVSKIYRYYISGSTPVIDTGVGNAGYTAIDSKYYVDTTTGQLALVGGAYWSIQRVFWVPNSPTNAFIVYYGNDRYRSLVDATNAKDSEPFIEAPNTAQNAIFIGYIIIQGGGSGTPARDLLNASEATIIPAGLFRNVGGIGSSGTNFVSTTLAGLADVSLSGNTPGDLLVYGTAATWNNKKQLTGSYGLTGSLTVTQNISASSFTGSLEGTASYATTASYVANAQTSSYVLQAVSASFATTASFALNSGGGGISRSVLSVAVNTSAGSTVSTDYIYLASNTITITLPTAASNTNRYTIKNVGTGVVSIATTSSQTIDGSSSPITINTQYVSLDLISDGSNWNII